MSKKELKVMTKEELIQEIGHICEILNWNIGIPYTSKNTVPGIVLGTNEFIDLVTANLDKNCGAVEVLEYDSEKDETKKGVH